MNREKSSAKVQDLRKQIRETNDEIYKLSIQRRKTHLILISTSKYPEDKMRSSIADFIEVRKTLAKLDEKLEKLFQKLFEANLEYLEAHSKPESEEIEVTA
ncbi:MAG: hypothetical protein E4H14_20370 [Candidatus Thorarchaeota archaeon]|nr:MAG: hypothetical protein E4H14_20370 [Candidatus Thorarchaeota archaeon]